MLYYHEMAEYYTFSKGKWRERKRNPNKGIISRLHMIFPSAGDLFYLRMLLLHRRGATSFQDLKTIDGTEETTYFDACKTLNLIEDDEIWEKTMFEAVAEYGQRYLIRLLAYILIFNEVN